MQGARHRGCLQCRPPGPSLSARDLVSWAASRPVGRRRFRSGLMRRRSAKKPHAPATTTNAHQILNFHAIRQRPNESQDPPPATPRSGLSLL